MKKLILITIALGSMAAWSIKAQDVEGRKGLTDEQLQQRKALIEKYDADGDGVLSKSEQKRLSKEDKKALAKTGGVGTARKPGKDADQEQDREQKRQQGRDRTSSDHSKRNAQGKDAQSGGNGNGKGGRK